MQTIRSLNPVSFHWIEDWRGDRTQYGFIAQEVQNTVPDLVSKTPAGELTPDGTLVVKYTGLIAPLVKAVQDIDSILATNSDVIEEVRGQCKMTEEQLASIEIKVEEHSRKIASLEEENAKKDRLIEQLKKENTQIKARLDRIEKVLFFDHNPER